MSLESFVESARRRGASDLHLEPGLAAAVRVCGELTTIGEPLGAKAVEAMARTVLGPQGWKRFRRRRSADLSRTLAGVRCRLNVLQSSRGVGLAVRLLAGFQPTLERLNLHPDLEKLVALRHGLVVVSGPTGSGKSSTLAALIQRINLEQNRHIVTIEHPIEYAFHPRKAFIRQREVGRDTPSFDQALIDAMREDPDVIMVGEMRRPKTMRLTLNAAETGHLVLSTVHSSSCAEALHRIASSFPPDRRHGVTAQLADCLQAVIAQRLVHRPELDLRVAELEILRATNAVRNLVRQGQFFQLPSVLETGRQDGQWTVERYRSWLDARTDWYVPEPGELEPPDSEPPAPPRESEPAAAPPPGTRTPAEAGEDVIVLQPPDESLRDILSELEES